MADFYNQQAIDNAKYFKSTELLQLALAGVACRHLPADHQVQKPALESVKPTWPRITTLLALDRFRQAQAALKLAARPAWA